LRWDETQQGEGVMASILLVEDNDAVREVLCQALEGAGHDAHCVHDLASARRELAAGRFECIVADVRLPDGKGYELVDVAGPARIPVILVTGHMDEVQSMQTFHAGRLMKPFTIDRLLDEVDKHIAAAA
jgi:DNA-binding NtrC family response regulator